MIEKEKEEREGRTEGRREKGEGEVEVGKERSGAAWRGGGSGRVCPDRNPPSTLLVEIDEERYPQVLQVLQNLSNDEEKHQEKSRTASSAPDPGNTMVINSHGLHRSIPNELGIRLPLGNHLQVDV